MNSFAHYGHTSETIFNDIRYSERIGVNRPCVGHAATGGHKTAVGNVEIVDIMGTAIRVQYRGPGIVAKAATTRNQVLWW